MAITAARTGTDKTLEPIRSTKNIIWKNRDFRPAQLHLVYESQFREGGIAIKGKATHSMANLTPATQKCPRNEVSRQRACAEKARQRLREKIDKDIPEHLQKVLSQSQMKELVQGCKRFMRESILARINGGENWSTSAIAEAKRCGSIREAAINHGHRPIWNK